MNKNNDTDKGQTSTNINWFPGHMAKTKREIRENLDLIDIVYELIDARIPYSSKNHEIDGLTKNKKRILIMTKSDLCDLDKTNRYLSYYKELGYEVVLIDLKNGNVNELLKKTDVLAKDLNDKRNKQGLKPRKIRVLIVGVPNVGKSTLINKLVSKKVAQTGNKPGVTKSLSWIRINDKLELMDTPGILWPKFENEEIGLNLASMTSIKEEILDLEEIAFYIIRKMNLEYRDNLVSRYKINSDDELEIINEIGKRIGALRNNEIDYERVYRTILTDLREGYLGRITFDNIDKN